MQRWVIGLAAGPSADGVVAALLKVGGQGLDLAVQIACWHVEPYSRELRDLVVRASTPEQGEVRQITLVHRLLGETFAAAARQVANRASRSLQGVLCIGCLGHLAWHDAEGRFPSTLELGLPAIVAERTGVTTIAEFRSRDLAAGGQGAPLGVLCDGLLFRDPNESRLVLDLGGLASASYLPPGDLGRRGHLADRDERGDAGLGWELGPCTVLLDSLMQQLSGGKERCDAGGKHAVQGRQIPELLGLWAHHPFLLRRPPRSAHRHLFAEAFARQTVALAQQKGWDSRDLLCTATHFIVRAIADGLQQFLTSPPPRLRSGEGERGERLKRATIDRILLCGGGVKNGLLWRLLEERLAGVPLERTDAHGVPAEARDALHAGILACLALDGTPATVPAATGAAGSRLLGSFTPGSLGNWQHCLAWMNGPPLGLLEEDD